MTIDVKLHKGATGTMASITYTGREGVTMRDVMLNETHYAPSAELRSKAVAARAVADMKLREADLLERAAAYLDERKLEAA